METETTETETTESASWVAAEPMVVHYDLTVGVFHATVAYRPDDSDDTLPWMWSIDNTAEDFEEECSWEATAEDAVAAAEEALRELIAEYEAQAAEQDE